MSIKIEMIHENYSMSTICYDALHHIYHTNAFGVFGALPVDIEQIIEQFELSEAHSLYKGNPKLWHFTLTFEDQRSDSELLLLAYEIALIFAPNYQVLYGLDKKEPDEPVHLHFAVNAFSYHPTVPTLNTNMMRQYMATTMNHIHSYYPDDEVTMPYESKKKRIRPCMIM